jgi:hypothetical protein
MENFLQKDLSIINIIIIRNFNNLWIFIGISALFTLLSCSNHKNNKIKDKVEFIIVQNQIFLKKGKPISVFYDYKNDTLWVRKSFNYDYIVSDFKYFIPNDKEKNNISKFISKIDFSKIKKKYIGFGNTLGEEINMKFYTEKGDYSTVITSKNKFPKTMKNFLDYIISITKSGKTYRYKKLHLTFPLIYKTRSSDTLMVSIIDSYFLWKKMALIKNPNVNEFNSKDFKFLIENKKGIRKLVSDDLKHFEYIFKDSIFQFKLEKPVRGSLWR